jgi:hypothetical protein
MTKFRPTAIGGMLPIFFATASRVAPQSVPRAGDGV